MKEQNWFWCKKSLKLGHTDTMTLKRGVIGMKTKNLFKWKHYQSEIILLTVRWYLRYNRFWCKNH